MTKTFLRIDAVKRVTGMATSSIYEEMAKGKFPKQVPLGPNRVAWIEDEILEWQQGRIAERDSKGAA